MADRKRRGGATDEQLQHERDALMSLAVESYPQRERMGAILDRNGVQLLSIERALHLLARETRQGTRVVPRLMVLNALVGLATRRGAQLFERENEAMNELLDALVQEAHPNADADLSDFTEELRASLTRLENADVVAAAWDLFVPGATRTLALTDAEQWGPRCTDEHTVTSKSGVVAAQVSSEFWTDRTPEQMASWADPRTWPDCSIYFESMEPYPQGSAPQQVAGPPSGWDCTFMEIVDAFVGHKLETPLTFTYREDLPDAVWSTYELYDPPGPAGPGTADILIDEGFLEARLKPNGPPGRPTHVRTLKVILFADDDVQDLVTLACDTFWTEAAITMALDCSDRGEPTTPAKKAGGAKKVAPKKTGKKTPTEPTGKDEPVPDGTEAIPGCDPELHSDLQKLVKGAVDNASKSVATYTEIAKRAAARAAEGNVDPAAWGKDLADATAVWVSDVTSAWTTWTQALNMMSGTDDESGPGDG